MAQELTGWLDHRRTLADAQRKPGTIDELAARRARMNPRLDAEWLRYLVTIGAREDADGWRWKIDPTLRFGGFGPWRPEWSMMRLPDIGVPVLAVLGTEPEPMGWGTAARGRAVAPARRRPVRARSRAPATSSTSSSPRQVADLVLEHVVVTRPPCVLRHNRHRAWPCTSCAPATGRPLLLLHGLGERTPVAGARRTWPPGPGRSGPSTSPATATPTWRPAAATSARC